GNTWVGVGCGTAIAKLPQVGHITSTRYDAGGVRELEIVTYQTLVGIVNAVTNLGHGVNANRLVHGIGTSKAGGYNQSNRITSKVVVLFGSIGGRSPKSSISEIPRLVFDGPRTGHQSCLVGEI
ncbi:hypothetical protein EBX93_13020, partial [bacterium]|nr:hypothetical protein [bacterium]